MIFVGFWRPKGSQAPPKNHQKSSKTLQKSILGCVWDTSVFEGGFGEGLGRVLGWFWDGFGRILEGFWRGFGRMLGGKTLIRATKKRSMNE